MCQEGWESTFVLFALVFDFAKFGFCGVRKVPQAHSDIWDGSGWNSCI